MVWSRVQMYFSWSLLLSFAFVSGEKWQQNVRLPSLYIMLPRIRKNFSYPIAEKNHWTPTLTPVLLPGESHGQRSLVGFLYGVTQSRTWLKQLSSSMNLVTWRLMSFSQIGGQRARVQYIPMNDAHNISYGGMKKKFIGPGLHLRPVHADHARPPFQWILNSVFSAYENNNRRIRPPPDRGTLKIII